MLRQLLDNGTMAHFPVTPTIAAFNAVEGHCHCFKNLYFYQVS